MANLNNVFAGIIVIVLNIANIFWFYPLATSMVDTLVPYATSASTNILLHMTIFLTITITTFILPAQLVVSREA